VNFALLAKYSPSKGPDNIDPLIASKTIGAISDMVSEIFNSSFSAGIVPGKLKIAKITPVFKQGDRHTMTNYRPISILPYFAKLLEKSMSTRLTNYIEKLNLMFPVQYGFRERHSTELTLIRIQDLITNAIDNKKFSVGIFLDFSKAFDTVYFSILLRKLTNYGMRENSIAVV